jgi:hypothetical protein
MICINFTFYTNGFNAGYSVLDEFEFLQDVFAIKQHKN